MFEKVGRSDTKSGVGLFKLIIGLPTQPTPISFELMSVAQTNL